MKPLKPVEPEFIEDLDAALRPLIAHKKCILLCDEHTLEHCLPLLNTTFQHTLVIKPGEAEKTLAVAEHIWKHLIAWNTNRHDLLICLGGGVISDLGAFSASVYQRGMPFVLIPTTLLAMTDAAVGGKTGVNLLHKKNYIGTFAHPEAIFIHPPFLNTLDRHAIIEGWAEILKHGLIADAALYRLISETALLNHIPDVSLLQRSIAVKTRIVAEDPLEENRRKLLNFGHTLGHALESWYLDRGKSVAHGTAVAAGMWMESLIANRMGFLGRNHFEAIAALIDRNFEPLMFSAEGIYSIAELCRYDKKNMQHDAINIVMLREPGHADIDGAASLEVIIDALNNYLECHRM